MKSVNINAFLSCSFSVDDQSTNDFVRSICAGLDMACKNVSDGYTDTPPEIAKELIKDCQVFLAVATKRSTNPDGSYEMPKAVREEISMAFALEKPSLIFLEKGIKADGFISNLGTYLEFERETLHGNEMIRKVVSSIHNLKLGVVSSQDLVLEQDTSGYVIESLTSLSELKEKGGQLTWVYSMSRKLQFKERMQSPIRSAAWATFPHDRPDTNHHILADFTIVAGNKPFKLIKQIERDDYQRMEVALTFDPVPTAGDYLTLRSYFESPYLNNIRRPADRAAGEFTEEGVTYHCVDGVVPVARTKSMKLQFRFTREYGLTKEDILPIVASHSSGIDYLVKSEMKRAMHTISDFGGDLVVDIETESPLLRHIYGLAWRIPSQWSAVQSHTAALISASNTGIKN